MAKKKKGKKPVAMPAAFLERLTDMVGPSLYGKIEKTFVARPTTFRVNTIKADVDEVKQALVSDGFKIQQVSWYKDAFILKNKTKRDLTKTAIYEQGKIYIQSLASMVPPLVLEPAAGETVLDLTAAPGSKTSQMAAMMCKQGELVANDVNKVRFYRLKANMEHLGVVEKSSPYQGELEGVQKQDEVGKKKKGKKSLHGNDRPLPTSPDRGGDWTFTLRLEDGSALCKEYDEPYFDKILLDAVCSAEARFVTGDPKTYGYWNKHKIKQMAYRQQKLLMAAWAVLKPGGTLVYSTCTWAPEENESRISKMIERHDDVIVEEVKIEGLKRLPAIMEWRDRKFDGEVEKTLRIMPTEEIEGFFVARLRKEG